MQISAANLLIASQQGAKAAPRPDGAFAAALVKEKPGFEPLNFKQAAAPKLAAAAPPSPQGVAPLGSKIDIRV
ncbi:MAG TPA: hypothetical protein VGC27_05300 [Rhizomicrobium sp.]